MKRWTEKEINEIIRLKDRHDEPIDIFRLHGVLFVGNTETGEWDLSKNYVMFSEHSIGFSIADFESCETEADVFEVFNEELNRHVSRRLL